MIKNDFTIDRTRSDNVPFPFQLYIYILNEDMFYSTGCLLWVTHPVAINFPKPYNLRT